MKRIVLVLLVAVLVAGSIFASEYKGINDKNQLSIGANLGSDTGFAVRYGLGEFDLIGNVGIDFFDGDIAFGGDAMISTQVYELDFGTNAKFPITVGAGLRTGFWTGDHDGLRLAAFSPVGIEYCLEDACDLPLSFYFRLGPQIWAMKETKLDFGFGFYAAIGGYWTF